MWDLLVWLTDLHSTWKGIFELRKLSSGGKSHGRVNSVTTVATVVESCHSTHPSSLRGSHFLIIIIVELSLTYIISRGYISFVEASLALELGTQLV